MGLEILAAKTQDGDGRKMGEIAKNVGGKRDPGRLGASEGAERQGRLREASVSAVIAFRASW